MTKWVVTRTWRDIEADRATDAMDAAQPGGHDETHVAVRRGAPNDMTNLLFQRDELEDLLHAIGVSITGNKGILDVAQSPQIRDRVSAQLNRLNSLRTYLSEARYALMSPREREQELVDDLARQADVDDALARQIPVVPDMRLVVRNDDES